VIDPLDGTTNYAHGYPRFCVSIGVERRGEAMLGVVFDPLLGELYAARRGAGATRNGVPIRVSSETRVGNALVATGFPYDIRQTLEDNLGHFVRVAKSVRAIRRDGSAALDLCYVACGRLDAFWELKLKPWDVVAGRLIVEEAGGRVTNLAGAPAPRDGRETLATNGAIHDAMRALLSGAPD
jgi:myo-inositol-1(or 4)-monophosphatase